MNFRALPRLENLQQQDAEMIAFQAISTPTTTREAPRNAARPTAMITFEPLWIATGVLDVLRDGGARSGSAGSPASQERGTRSTPPSARRAGRGIGMNTAQSAGARETFETVSTRFRPVTTRVAKKNPVC